MSFPDKLKGLIMRVIVSSLEKHLSFAALGSFFGVCNDIATPLSGSSI
jgi:hypothetical protein